MVLPSNLWSLRSFFFSVQSLRELICQNSNVKEVKCSYLWFSRLQLIIFFSSKNPPKISRGAAKTSPWQEAQISYQVDMIAFLRECRTWKFVKLTCRKDGSETQQEFTKQKHHDIYWSFHSFLAKKTGYFSNTGISYSFFLIYCNRSKEDALAQREVGNYPLVIFQMLRTAILERW